jgi:hypothetical protein
MAETFEVPTPILNGPYDPPKEHWKIEPDRPAVRMPGRRQAGYFYRPQKAPGEDAERIAGEWRELELVNLVRKRMAKWQAESRPGLTRMSGELIAYWRREGRQHRLFFAQLEAAETIIFLKEARADYLQGIAVPPDEPSDDRKAEGFSGFERYCCKMATGSGKSTVMAMLAAWSILNKVASRSDARRQPSRRRMPSGTVWPNDLRQHLRHQLAEQRIVTGQVDKNPRRPALVRTGPIARQQRPDQSVQPPYVLRAVLALDRQRDDNTVELIFGALTSWPPYRALPGCSGAAQ